jgi:hypothetical protein
LNPVRSRFGRVVAVNVHISVTAMRINPFRGSSPRVVVTC